MLQEPTALTVYIGSVIRLERESRKWTQRQLAKKIGAYQEYVSRLERGLYSLDARQLDILSNVFEKRIV